VCSTVYDASNESSWLFFGSVLRLSAILPRGR